MLELSTTATFDKLFKKLPKPVQRKAAATTNLNRESLYKILSERGNPEWKSLDVLLHALGFRLAVTANR